MVQACCNSETCRSPSRAVLSPHDASLQQQMAGMQLCSSDIKFNFLLIANMQQHGSARQTDLRSWRRQKPWPRVGLS